MADNVDITAGAGTAIATDDCTSGQVQLVKLAYGADGDRTHVPADADGLLVNLVNNNVAVTGTVTAETNLGKAEDSAHTTGDVGVMALAVRQDSAAALADTTGDYAPLQVDSLGNLRVNGAAMQSALGVNSSTTLLADAATFTGTGELNEYPDVMVSCFADAPGTLYFEFSVNNSDWRTFPVAGFAVALNTHEFHTAVKGPRYFRVRFVDTAGTAQGVFQLYTYYGTFRQSNAPLNQSLSSDSDAAVVKAVISGETSGGAYENVGITTGGNLKIVIEEIAEQTPTMNTGNAAAGTLRVVLATDQPSIDVDGNVAHDAADSGNPVKLGHKAIAHGTNPTAVAAADRTDWYASRAGVPFVIGGHPNVISLRATYTSAQTDVALVTVSAGTKIVVTQAQVAVSNATTATPSVIIGFGTANTPTTTGVVLAHPGIPGGGGISRGDGSGILGVGADDADLRITISVPTGGTLDTIISYYTIES